MYKTFYSILIIIWILDIIDIPTFSFLDTILPINGLAWCLIWLLLPEDNNIDID